jgi:hypothetical protein
MLIITQDDNKPEFNKPLYGLFGKYTLSENLSLPYFAALIDIERAIGELKIAEQIPASLDTKWSLKELFQREIDEKRVREDIVKAYLLDPKKIKFFNAITIILMPKNPDGIILESFDESISVESPPVPWDGSDSEDRQWNHPKSQVSNFGGVQFISIGISGRLRWDSKTVLAVAVDGQHRLFALRTLREDQEIGRGGSLRSHEQETKIPVIFVLLHSSVGFTGSNQQEEYSIRKIARELFTDLNKNAKVVDKARELILDDKSINAQCVRTLLTDSTTEDSHELIPLSLVRWQDDTNRFDSSYYLNSLVHLNLLISDLLDLKLPKDPIDYNQVLSFIESINLALGIDGKEVHYEGRPLSRYYLEDCCDEEENPHTPFSRLPDIYLDSAIDGFKVNFRPWLLKLLLDFKPYQNLLTYARQENLVEGTFGKFYAQTSKHRNAILQQETGKDGDWHRREILAPQDIISKMKEDQWAFKAIFQKALVRLGKVIEFDTKTQNKTLGNIDELLLFLNQLYDRKILDVFARFPPGKERIYSTIWTFIALNPGNQKIKVARAVENRIFSILSLWYYGFRKLRIDAEAGSRILSSRQLLQFFYADKHKIEWALVVLMLVKL